MSTNCSVIQLLEADPPSNLIISDDGNSLAVEEGGALALTIGVVVYNVLFTVPKVIADYDFVEADIASVNELTPLTIEPYMPTDGRTVNGFRLELSAAPDTSNYRFNWLVRAGYV